jgi:UDP-N-acetylglucosamine acyltransferase
MSNIHSTAILSPGSDFERSVKIGPYSIIDKDVTIGSNTEISSHVRIDSFTRIGKNCKIFQGAVLGSIPQDLKFKGEHSELIIGDNTTIREHATVNRGTSESGRTVIGNHCLIMAYVHVAHDCEVGDHVILSNATNLAGHITIEDYAIIGGLVPIHQFVRIGTHAFIGGGYRVSQDVPPYILAAGEPLRFCGLNYVGLTRNNFSKEQIKTLEKAYHLLYRSKINTSAALQAIRSEMEINAEIKNVIRFIEQSQRGIIRSS